jgi:GxxExxY protein
MGLNREGTPRSREGFAKVVYPELSSRIVRCAMNVHTNLGPGLLESAYEECLCHELTKAKIGFRRQVPWPLEYQGVRLDCGFRLDLVVDDKVVIEAKAVDQLTAVHDAQVLTYLKVTGLALGILINFNVVHLRNGIRRQVLSSNLRESFA